MPTLTLRLSGLRWMPTLCQETASILHSFTRHAAIRGGFMRVLLTAVFSGAILCGAAVAQQTPTTDPQTPRSDEQPSQPTQQGQSSAQPSAAQPNGANHMKIAPGSVIPVQLSKTVDAKKAKTGDEVVATVTMDMKTNSGDVLVPKDTKVIGHVTEAQARNKDQKQSELGIAFDRAEIKGEQTQLPMSIQAVIAPPSASHNANAGGSDQAPSAPSAPAGNSQSSPMGGSHPGGTSGASPSAQQNYPQGGGNSESQPQSNDHPPITGNTQGVIGMSNVKLESGSQNSQQGSVLTSEKNNVKIEKGTVLLLRVNQ